MIRDEFLNQQDKDLSTKDIVGIKTMGERAYYISTLNKTNSLINNLNFTTISLLVIAIITTLLLVYMGIQDGMFSSNYYIFGFIFAIILWVWIILWVAILNPCLKKKKQKFQGYMKKLSDREITKQKSIYGKLNNN